MMIFKSQLFDTINISFHLLIRYDKMRIPKIESSFADRYRAAEVGEYKLCT
jgi:hypothetical protein